MNQAPPERPGRVSIALPRLGTSAAGLDSQFMADSAQRLKIFALVIAVGFLMAFVFYDLILMPEGGDPYHLGAAADLLVLALALAVYLRICVSESCTASTLRVGFALELLAVLVTTVPTNPIASNLQAGVQYLGVPWGCVIMVIFPLIVPARPLHHGLVALAAASLFPLAALIEGLLGWGWPPLRPFVFMALPGYMCAVLALVSASTLWKLGLEVSGARKELQELGSYQLQRKLGGGGMGEVWLAEHRMLKRPAAVKLIKASLLEEAGEAVRLSLARFEREALATASLRSSHTVELYDFGRTEDGSFYYVMELLDGIDLEELVETDGPQPPARVIDILAQACLSLAEAHGQGLLHRDIKPANLILARLGEELDTLKVLDFGFVLETTQREDSPRLTGDHLVGTPAYFAPEAVLGDPTDARADLYSLACVGYWLLTGKLVFERETAMKMILAHAKERPEPPSARTEREIPPELETLLVRCLSKDPRDRPASARELRAALLACPSNDSWSETERRAWWKGRGQSPDLDSAIPEPIPQERMATRGR